MKTPLIATAALLIGSWIGAKLQEKRLLMLLEKSPEQVVRCLSGNFEDVAKVGKGFEEAARHESWKRALDMLKLWILQADAEDRNK